jgi:hypothetical protein
LFIENIWTDENKKDNDARNTSPQRLVDQKIKKTRFHLFKQSERIENQRLGHSSLFFARAIPKLPKVWEASLLSL